MACQQGWLRSGIVTNIGYRGSNETGSKAIDGQQDVF
jgi:hypothetical protein